MKIIKRGQTLREWFLSTTHVCRHCHTEFQPEQGDAFSEWVSCDDIEIQCPHCTKTLRLSKPAPSTSTQPRAYEPIFIPYMWPVPYTPPPCTPYIHPTIMWGSFSTGGTVPIQSGLDTPDYQFTISGNTSGMLHFNNPGTAVMSGFPPAPISTGGQHSIVQ